VAKPLSRHLQACRCFGGNTIMGDGRVAMILDSTGIAAVAGLRFAEVTAEERLRRQREAARRQESAERHSIVIFTVCPEERFALDLMSLARLERIDPRSIVSLGGREFIQHLVHGLPLLRLDKVLPVRPLPENPPELFIIIPRTQGQSVGILASQIVDALETEARVVEYKGRRPGITGSAIVEGRLTLFLDARGLVDLVDLSQAQAWLKEAEKTWAQEG
jgi:two-component system chemotaxis sensor kinase CheA